MPQSVSPSLVPTCPALGIPSSRFGNRPAYCVGLLEPGHHGVCHPEWLTVIRGCPLTATSESEVRGLTQGGRAEEAPLWRLPGVPPVLWRCQLSAFLILVGEPGTENSWGLLLEADTCTPQGQLPPQKAGSFAPQGKEPPFCVPRKVWGGAAGTHHPGPCSLASQTLPAPHTQPVSSEPRTSDRRQ